MSYGRLGIVACILCAGCIGKPEKSAETPSQAGTPSSAQAEAKPVNAFPLVEAGCVRTADKPNVDVASLAVIGRAENSAEQGIRFTWSGTSVKARFTGPSLHVELLDTGYNRFYVSVDGVLQPGKLVPEPGRHCYELAHGLKAGEHEVVLSRLTEPVFGESAVLGMFADSSGGLMPITAPAKRRIEVIGDSITAAYGVEARNQFAHFTADTENHALSYAALVATRFDAELTTVAWSGKGVFSNRGNISDTVTMPVLWERTLAHVADSRWDFAKFQPDLVIINLGTNDFAPEVTDVSPFAEEYLKFLRKVRGVYPGAAMICALGPLLTDEWPKDKRALTTARKYIQEAVEKRQREGDRRVYFLEHKPTPDVEGWGADWHPSKKTHARMADELSPLISRVLAW